MNTGSSIRGVCANTDKSEEVKRSVYVTVTAFGGAIYLVSILPFSVQHVFCLNAPRQVVPQSGQNNPSQTNHLMFVGWRHLRIHKRSTLWTHCIH